MAIELLTEDVISLREVPGLCPRRRRGKRPHISCVYRWTVKGCRGVTLESLDVGGTRCTSKQALVRFFQMLSSQRTSARPVPVPSVRRIEEETERALDQEGITLDTVVNDEGGRDPGAGDSQPSKPDRH